MLSNIKNFIRNLWNYKRFLWINRWWDSHYIFFMLREKLLTDARFYKKYGCHKHVDKDIEKMLLCVKLLNRIIDDDYLQKSLLFYEKKYPNWVSDGGLSYIPDKEWFRRCSKQADRQNKQDINYLFTYLDKHIKEFWD